MHVSDFILVCLDQ